jgi:hypothetical protein
VYDFVELVKFLTPFSGTLFEVVVAAAVAITPKLSSIATENPY